MKKVFFLGALVASTLLVGCIDESELEGISDSDPEETLGEVSAALASGCSHTSFVWTTSSGTVVNGQGAVSCNAKHPKIVVDVGLRRDGTLVRQASAPPCFDATSCSVRVNHPNPAGTQQWCAPSRAGSEGILDHNANTHCRIE